MRVSKNNIHDGFENSHNPFEEVAKASSLDVSSSGEHQLIALARNVRRGHASVRGPAFQVGIQVSDVFQVCEEVIHALIEAVVARHLLEGLGDA